MTKVGIVLPQGLNGEYAGWDPGEAWLRTVEVAQKAERLGFESIWAYDHFHTMPDPTQEISFEAFTILVALAERTTSVRLGMLVMCAAFRNPALAAKMLSTFDVVSNGRVEIGIGAGWKRDEWEAYGYGFPSTGDRLAILADSLEVITRMLRPGVAEYQGPHAQVSGAINVPTGIQSPRIPVMVGGNGAEVTWRLAARHADELSLDGMLPSEVEQALPVIAQRCEEIGRDPRSLKVSINVWSQRLPAVGRERVSLLAAYRDLGLSRIHCLILDSVADDGALDEFAEDCRTAGLEMGRVVQ